MRFLLIAQPRWFAGLLLLASMFALAQGTDKNTLPELGTPQANTASLQPNVNPQGAGFNYRDNINGKIISISPQYNRQNGVAVSGSLASPLGKNMAAGILLMTGEERNEWLLNAGIDFSSHHRMIFSLGQLRQHLNFNFISGAEKTQITQDNLAASYQYLLGRDWINAAELNTYVSDANSVKLSDKTFFTDSATFYELWNDPRRIAGGRVIGAQGRLVLTPATKTTIKVGLGAERLTYDYLMGNESITRATGSAELLQRLDNDFNFRASVNAAASQNRYALGLGKSFNDGAQLGIDIANIQSRDNTYNDTQLQLTYTQNFGSGNNSAPASNPLALNNMNATGALMNQDYANTTPRSSATNSWTSSLVEQVARRPTFLPSQVIAKVDTSTTPVRLIAIDKTATPPGSIVATSTGIYTVPIGRAVSAIASVALNGLAFANSGQFNLSDNKLVINPNLILPPAVGVTDTYVVTMNNAAGGGTTLATVTVTNGSTKIDSIVISNDNIIPTLTGLSLSATSVSFGAAAPTITAPTSLSNGAITYTSGTGTTATITSAGVITIVGVGTTVITATQAASGNYASTTDTITLTVNSAGAVVSGGLTWTRNNTTASTPTGLSTWTIANNTCNGLTQGGFTWRLPTSTELLALYNAGTAMLNTAGWNLIKYAWTSSPAMINQTVVSGSYGYVDMRNGNTGNMPDLGFIDDLSVSCVR